MQQNRLFLQLSPYLILAVLCCLSLLTIFPAFSQSTKIADASLPRNNYPKLRPPLNGSQLNGKQLNSDQQVVNQLDSIAKEAQETEGALFVKPDEVRVKAPMLKALIELHQNLSPYGLDAESEHPITLRQALIDSLVNNLDIKVTSSEQESSRWQFISTLGNFLPSIENAVTYQSIKGNFASPFGAMAPVNSPFLAIPSGLQWTAFNGGANLFTAKKAKHEFNASKFDLKRNTNDILSDTARLYYDLVLQDVLLQIRIKAVQTSEALLTKNQIQYQFGANTQLDVLQAQTQLARDRQALISQQVARRKAAVALSTTLNLNGDDDLIVGERTVSKVRLVNDNRKIAELIQTAVETRPELKKWEQLRLAARDAIHIAFAPLLPQVIGQAGLATTGANVARAINSANIASVPATGAFGIGGFGTTSVSAIGSTSGPKKFNLAEIYLIGLNVQWQIGGMGLTDTAKVNAAKWQARKAQTEFARELTYVCREVRDAYLNSLDQENLILATTDEVNSAREQLRVAVTRLEEGVGEDLDVVNAQRNYTDALINKASAIVKFNQAQVALLRATGQISVDSITSPTPVLH